MKKTSLGMLVLVFALAGAGTGYGREIEPQNAPCPPLKKGCIKNAMCIKNGKVGVCTAKCRCKT